MMQGKRWWMCLPIIEYCVAHMLTIFGTASVLNIDVDAKLAFAFAFAFAFALFA